MFTFTLSAPAVSAVSKGAVGADAIACRVLREPITEGRVSSDFGEVRKRGGRRSIHEGLDYAAAMGTPVLATAPGRIAETGSSRSYGRFVVVEHQDGLTSLYAHLSRAAATAKIGARVRATSVIGYVGKTGRVTGANLHFEVRLDAQPIDPAAILDAIASADGSEPCTERVSEERS